MMIISESPSPPVSTFERWLAERERRSGGIVPPWLEPDKAWPPMPGPDTEVVDAHLEQQEATDE